MNWVHVVIATLVAGVLASLIDWLFMGSFIYRRYDRYPEIWRHPQGKGEGMAIALSAPFPFLTCAVFMILSTQLDLHAVSQIIGLAVAIWLIGPCPLLVVQGLFVKLHPAVTIAYCAGWLLKLGVAAGAAIVVLC